jgi:predicted glycoside hydrolase/deacetylase ChbG (UPF0249 family)
VHTPPAERRLIINADDFGLTEGVNRAILEVNAAHALSSATLMATGSAFRDAVHGAFRQPSLRIGCHVVLLDGYSQLHPAELPTLASNGRLRPTLGAFVADLLRGRIAPREIEQEAIAQIRRLQSAGITVTHLDTHKHTHIFPQVLRPLLRAALACGVGAVRNPFEPAWSLRLTPNAPRARHLQVRTLRIFRRYFLRAVRTAGLCTPNGALGVLATGTLDVQDVLRLFTHMPPGTWELVCHPGYVDPALEQANTRLITTRETERTALLQAWKDVPASTPPFEVIHYGGLTR